MRQRLVQFIGIGCLAIILPLGLFAQDGLVSPNRLVIQGGTLISGTGEAPVPNAVIVIEGKRITAVGAAGSVSIPSAAEIIQADGKFILPGFADMHVHWFCPGLGGHRWHLPSRPLRLAYFCKYITGARKQVSGPQ